MRSISETETVVKRILPYLRRRGYDDGSDLEYETGAAFADRYGKGYVDILVTCGKPRPQFLVEAKRLSRSIGQKDEKQALEYGQAFKVPFVVVTNGMEMRCLNVANGQAIRWDGTLRGLVPPKHELPAVTAYLRRHSEATDVPLSNEGGLPFRPGLPLRQLNGLFAKCHTTIRNIEKQEETAFADFSKILFLKLLEEKADLEGTALPYSYLFYELAATPPARADQVKDAIQRMIKLAEATYGDVLADPLRLNNPATFLKIVRALSEVSFTDSEADVKGAAFEYFVRATLKGKRLGQYFTPRPLVHLMVAMVGREKVVATLRTNTPVTVIDPACGTGGFLVYMLRDAIAQVQQLHLDGKLTPRARDNLIESVKRTVFYGADANESVASAAKMNMIIAGDGHANISAEDTLTAGAGIWTRDIDLILSNPPFGTSQADSLTEADGLRYPFPKVKGQLLFLQRMVTEVAPEGMICTVIDEGALNTDTAAPVRRMILENTELLAVVRLPPETFKPNKINVRAALLLMKKREYPDVDLTQSYGIHFVDITSLGYDGSGMSLRGFDFQHVLEQLANLSNRPPGIASGAAWRRFEVKSAELVEDSRHRFDLKYWEPDVRRRLTVAAASGATTIGALNLIPTSRGASPRSDRYVDPKDGYARVLKAGSSIDMFGNITPVSSVTDYVEKEEYDTTNHAAKLKSGDVVLSSTGSGTLGKCAVYSGSEPAIADGHITIIRVDPAVIDPYYLADYLRAGFGHDQIERLYTGSTGLIELTPGQVNAVLIPVPSRRKQKAISKALRAAEAEFVATQESARRRLDDARRAFAPVEPG